MRPRLALNKIAEVTLGFWMAKAVATTLGETMGDFFAQTLGFGYVAGLAATTVLLAALLVAQVASDAYRSPLFCAALVALVIVVAGSDRLDRVRGAVADRA